MTTDTQPTLNATFRARMYGEECWFNMYTDKPMTDQDLYEEAQYRTRTYGKKEYPFPQVYQWSHDGMIYQLSWQEV